MIDYYGKESRSYFNYMIIENELLRQPKSVCLWQPCEIIKHKKSIYIILQGNKYTVLQINPRCLEKKVTFQEIEAFLGSSKRRKIFHIPMADGMSFHTSRIFLKSCSFASTERASALKVSIMPIPKESGKMMIFCGIMISRGWNYVS